MLKKIIVVVLAAVTIISGMSVPVMAARKDQDKVSCVIKRPKITTAKSAGYGLSKNFFSCKAYEVEFDEDKWTPDLAYDDSLNINYAGKETSPVSIWIHTMPLSGKEKRMTIKKYIQCYMNECSESYAHPIMKNIGGRRIAGRTFMGVRDLSNPDYTVGYIFKSKKTALFIRVECDRDRDIDDFREDIDEVFSEIKLKEL